MAVKNYTSLQVIEDTMLIEIDSNWTDELDRFMEQVEDFIDTYTGRNFVADEDYSDLLFDGDGEKEMIIPDCVDIESIIITEPVSGVESTYEWDDDYFLAYPASKTPKNSLEFRDTNSFDFAKGQQNVTISAKWGYSTAVPREIELAATILMAGVINYAYEHNSEVRSETIGNYSVTYQREEEWVKFKLAMQILDKYKKVSF